MSINFIKTLRQQDLKIINLNENKYLGKVPMKAKENKLFLNNFSANTIRDRNPSLEKISFGQTMDKQFFDDLKSDRTFRRNNTFDRKNLLIKNTHSVNKTAEEKIQANPLHTKNNFFLSANRLNLQSRGERNNVFFSKNDQNEENEFKFLRKPLTANVTNRRKEGLTKGQNQLILEKLSQKYNFNAKPNKKNSTANNFFPNIASKFNDIKDENMIEGLKTFNNFRPRRNKNEDLNIQYQLKSDYVQDSLKSNQNFKEAHNDTIFDFKYFKNQVHDHHKMNDDEEDIIIQNEIIKEESKDLNSKNEYFQKDFHDEKILRHFNYKIEEDRLKQKSSEIFIKSDSKSERHEREEKSFQSTPNLNTNHDNISSENKTFLSPSQKLKNIKNNLIQENEEKIDKNKKSPKNTIKSEDVNIANVLKRVLENNKREASVRQRELYTSYPKNYLNLNNHTQKPQSNFYMGSNPDSRPSTEFPQKSYLNSLEFSFQAIPLWKKHEEIWINVASLGFIISPELEKYLLPPNEIDVLLSSYCKLSNDFKDKIIINDSLQYPNEELIKWKNAYKKAVMRWHPDKLFPLIDRFKLKDESKKNILKKKASHIMNNMYKMMQNILEILRKIIKNNQNNTKN